MDENRVKQIAQDHVDMLNLDPCSIASVRRFPRSEIADPSTVGDEWVVQFQFELPDGVVQSSAVAIVVVDDATGEASMSETL